MMTRAALVLLPVVLAGCASLGPSASYVSGVGPDDAQTIARDVADRVVATVPPPRVAIAATTRGQDTSIAHEVSADLEHAGYAVVRPAVGVPWIRYWVTPIDGGAALCLFAGQTETSRFYARDSGGALSPAGPYAVRQFAWSAAP